MEGRDELELPDGLTSRVLTHDDAQAVYDVMAAQELADVGKVEIELADIVSDWSRPSWDIATSTIGVFDGARLVAYAELVGHDRGACGVHPDYRRRGIGTALAGWLEETVRRHGDPAPRPARGLPDPQRRALGVPRRPRRDRGRVHGVVKARPADL
jgi:mycothiol synthase